MKAEINVPIIVAALTAAASIFGVFYNQNSALKLERQKWEQTVESERLKLEREAVTDFAKTMASAFYLSENMIWRIEMMPGTLTQEDFQNYADAAEAIKPKLATAQVVLAATSPNSHEKVKAALAEYRRVDENLIVSGRAIDKHRTESLQSLDREVKNLGKFRELVLGSLANAASVRVGER